MIQSRTAWRWLCKLEYKYKDVHKDVFINGREWSDVIEDHKDFLNKMEELKPYIIKFDEDGAIKPKVYPLDCIVGGNDR